MIEKDIMMSVEDKENWKLGEKVKGMRADQGMSLRMLGKKSGISPAMISMIENNRVSPTLTKLHKLLAALGTTFGDFFSNTVENQITFYFPKGKMKTIGSKRRRYTIILPRHRDIKMQMVREEISPDDKPEMETHGFDVAGYLLEGGPLKLEILDGGEWMIQKGDAFYVPAGKTHRGINTGRKTVVMVTSFYPPRY